MRPFSLEIDMDMQNNKIFARDIIKEICKEYGVSYEGLTGKNPHLNLRQARTRAIWRIKQETDFSFARIAGIFGRDHSTIIHIYRVAERNNGYYYNKSYKIYGGGKQENARQILRVCEIGRAHV